MRYFDRLPMWARKAVVYGGLAAVGVTIIAFDIAGGYYTVGDVVLATLYGLVIFAFAWRDYYVTVRRKKGRKA